MHIIFNNIIIRCLNYKLVVCFLHPNKKSCKLCSHPISRWITISLITWWYSGATKCTLCADRWSAEFFSHWKLFWSLPKNECLFIPLQVNLINSRKWFFFIMLKEEQAFVFWILPTNQSESSLVMSVPVTFQSIAEELKKLEDSARLIHEEMISLCQWWSSDAY